MPEISQIENVALLQVVEDGIELADNPAGQPAPAISDVGIGADKSQHHTGLNPRYLQQLRNNLRCAG